VNEIECKQDIFTEYERFTRISGLKLNAEKTEILNFNGGLQDVNLLASDEISYLRQRFKIKPVKEIKINGILLCKNLRLMKEINLTTLMAKQDKHLNH
jgi:hypothetical protein